MSSTTTKSKTTATRPTNPGLITGLIIVATVGCGIGSRYWAPLRWINERAGEVQASDGAMIAMGVASVAAIGAGFSGVVVAYAISSERPTVVEFRRRVGPLLKANWMSVINCSFSSAVLALADGTLFVTGHPSAAAWVSVAAVGLLLHGMARSMYLFSVFLEVVALGDRRDNAAAAVIPLDKVVTKRTSSM